MYTWHRSVKNMISAPLVVSKVWDNPSPSLYFWSAAIRKEAGVIFLKYPSLERNTWTE